VRGKGRQPLSPPQHTETRSATSAPFGTEIFRNLVVEEATLFHR